MKQLHASIAAALEAEAPGVKVAPFGTFEPSAEFTAAIDITAAAQENPACSLINATVDFIGQNGGQTDEAFFAAVRRVLVSFMPPSDREPEDAGITDRSDELEIQETPSFPSYNTERDQSTGRTTATITTQFYYYPSHG